MARRPAKDFFSTIEDHTVKLDHAAEREASEVGHKANPLKRKSRILA